MIQNVTNDIKFAISKVVNKKYNTKFNYVINTNSNRKNKTRQ